ncbi:MAG TPA: ABC transporter ATP-binding protein [Pseudogracilibacillus sp.]|nr:ABC transporter ATP-binding protein [Pseudogracilibacillus sp.]
MLNVQSLSKYYGKKKVFDDLSFTVHEGEIVGLVGENGAGKSTLLEIVATLEQPTSGELYFHDKCYSKQLNTLRRDIGYVPQEISVWDHLSVRDNMRFFSTLAWKKRSEDELRNICEEMNVYAWNEEVSTLSGGTKRKVNLAISLIHEPKLLLLDEPTAGIDLKSKQEIADYLKRLAIRDRVTILYISHDMDEIMNLCDYVFTLGEDPFYETYLTERGQGMVSLTKQH